MFAEMQEEPERSFFFLYVSLVGDWVSPIPVYSGCGRDITLRSTQGMTTLTLHLTGQHIH